MIQGDAPSLHAWVGATDCCGEDPHPVHGVVLNDSSVVLVGKNEAGRKGTSGFVTRWRVAEGHRVGLLADDNEDIISASLVLDSSSALVQVLEVGERIVAVGFEADSGSSPARAVALVLDPESLQVLSRLEVSGPLEGSSAVFESMALSPSGQLLIGGSWGSTRSEIEGLKSYGNVFGGHGVLVRVDPEAWFAASAEVLQPTDIGAVVLEIPEVHSVKSLSVASSGDVAGVGHNEEERSGVFWATPELDSYQWTVFDDGIELSAVEVLVDSNGQSEAVLVGHGGEGTIDGHAKKVDGDGTVLWATSFGNPAVADAVEGPAALAPEAFVFDECWGVVAYEDGVAVACGTGIENCSDVGGSASDKKACKEDPRRSWRSFLVGISGEGELSWSRAEAFVDMEGEVHESASEHITIDAEGRLYSVVDQSFGVSLAVLGD